MKGLTQKALARAMGAKPAMVSALLNGERRLNEDWIEKFCAALEITLTPIETKHHSPRKFHASRIAIQGVLVEIVRRSARRKR